MASQSAVRSAGELPWVSRVGRESLVLERPHQSHGLQIGTPRPRRGTWRNGRGWVEALAANPERYQSGSFGLRFCASCVHPRAERRWPSAGHARPFRHAVPPGCRLSTPPRAPASACHQDLGLPGPGARGGLPPHELEPSLTPACAHVSERMQRKLHRWLPAVAGPRNPRQGPGRASARVEALSRSRPAAPVPLRPSNALTGAEPSPVRFQYTVRGPPCV